MPESIDILSISPAAAMLALGLACCAHFGERGGREGFDERLARVDDHLRAREQPGHLDEALVILEELRLDVGDHPELLWRIARVRYAQAYGAVDPDADPLRLYEAGRETAWRCIYQDPAFQGVLGSTGGRIGPAAVERITEEHESCLLWLVANWSRWLALRGPAAFALDLEPLQLLADRAVELHAGRRRALALGFAGMGRALAPVELTPDLDAAGGMLKRAIQQDPENASLRVDLAEYVYGPLEDRERFQQTLDEVLASTPVEGEHWLLENNHARARARLLLSSQSAPDVDTPGQP
jgi:tetratricopeptide (TPR) repeat protein